MKLDRLCTTIHSTEVLRRMILENPDLPLLVFAGEEANSGDYGWMCCTDVRVEKGEVLDCAGPKNEHIYTDREELEDDVAYQLYDEFSGLDEDEYATLLKKKMAKYEEYWTECIILRVTN